MGLLLALQYVHYVEHKVRKAKYSFLRFIITMMSILGLAWLLAETGGFNKSHWAIDLLGPTILLSSAILLGRYFLRKKGISLLDKPE